MKLEEYLETEIFKDICLLWFNEDGLKSLELNYRQRKQLCRALLNMEVMEVVTENDCKEIWLR